MLAFLQQTMLYLLPVITIPILIHLFTRQKSKKILFSSLAFLKEMQNQNLRRIKIKQILIIVIRTLIILFLVLSFARPTLRSMGFTATGPTAATSTVVLILDNSMSMAAETNGVSLFDLARKKSYQLLNTFHQGDEFFLISPLSHGLFDTAGPFYGLKNIQDAIQNTTVLDGSTDISRGLMTADQILKESNNANREVFLISDMQETGFSTPIDSLIFSTDARVFWLPVNDDGISNVGISSVSLKNQILEQNKPIQIEATVTNYGATPLSNQLVQLFINGRRIQQATVSVPSASAQIVQFSFTPKTNGFLSGMLRLEDDALVRDNKSYFTCYLPPSISVLLVGPSTIATFPVRIALKPSDSFQTPIIPTRVNQNALSTTSLQKYDVIILNNVNRISADVAHKIQQYVHDGGNLIFLPGSNTDIRNFNSTLAERLKLPQFSTPTGRAGNKDSYVSFGKIDFSHPIFEPLFENSEPVIDSPQLYFSFGVQTQPNSQTLIALSNQQAFLTETVYGSGKVMVFSSSIESDWSNWATKGIFAPLFNRTVNYLAATQNSQQNNYFVGNPLIYQVTHQLSGHEFSAQLPDGNTLQIFPEITTRHISSTITNTKSAGIYRLDCNEEQVANWAVNIEENESNLTPLDENAYPAFFENNTIIELNTTQTLAEQINSSRYGRELWPVFLMLALLLLAVEMLLMRHPAAVGEPGNIQ